MYNVSQYFKDMMRSINRQIGLKVVINGIEFSNDKIIELDIENNLTDSEKFSLGTVIASRLNFSLRDFDLDIPENALVEPYVRFEGGILWSEVTDSWNFTEIPWNFDFTEWVPLGKFYIDNRVFANQRVWKFECYDAVMFLHKPYVSTLEYPQSMRTILIEACNQAGIEIENIEEINIGYHVDILPNDLTLHKVIGYIAGANCCSATINRDGKLRFIKFNQVMHNNHVETLTLRDYFKATQKNNVKAFDTLKIFEKDGYTEGNLYENKYGTGNENTTLAIANPFVTEEIIDDIYANMNGFQYIPYELDYKCFPHLEVGDVISIEQSKGSSWLETSETWGTADFPWNYDLVSFNVIVLHNKITYRGGLRATLKAEAESVQSSEFKVKGTLREYIETVDKASVKEGRLYNGVTTSREEGVVVERSDGKAKTIMNATEGISIYSDSGSGLERNFFVDLDGRIKARELDIDGSGTFGGTIEANQIDTSIAKISTVQIEELIAGPSGNVTIGSDVTLTWQQIDDADTYVTTIAEDTIRTGNIYAQNLEVHSANIIGNIKADSLSTTAQINVGTDAYIGDQLFLGNLADDAYKGVYFGADTYLGTDSIGNISLSSKESIDIVSGDDIMLLSIGQINLLTNDGVYADGSRVATTSDLSSYLTYSDLSNYATQAWVSNNFASDYHSHSEYASESWVERNFVEAYYSANKCYIDASASQLVIRDQNGDLLGYIPYA